MSAVAALTDEEAYLVAILDDPSGVELAEFCIAEGQLVLTARGHVPIEEVLVGDMVLTHMGRWRRVTAVYDRGVKPVVRMKGVGHHGLLLTPGHRVFSRRARQGLKSIEGHRDVYLESPEWVEAKDLEFGSRGRVRNTRYATPRVDSLPIDSPPHAWDENLAWLMGRWLADGSTATTRGDNRRLSWAIRDRDLEEVSARLRKVGTGALTVQGTKSVHCFNLVKYGRDWHDWTVRNFGKLAGGKHLPPWAFGMPEHLREALFCGWLSGDGSVRKDGLVGGTTVSRALAYDMRVLAASLGLSVSVKIEPGGALRKFGTVVQARDLYGLTFCGTGWSDDDGLRQWSMWKSRTDAGEAHVWDLSVEQDHSFVVEGVTVHNCFLDEEQDDGCFRLWDFQWKAYRCEETYQIDWAGRGIGKSSGIIMRACAFPLNYPGQEMMITAPELNHLSPLTKKVEEKIMKHRLLREMLPNAGKGRSNGITKQPHFEAHFVNGSKIVTRIPNRDGRGVLGQHPLVIEHDEAQSYPDAGWTEIIETMKKYVKGAQWRVHGVSRGVRDRYYRYTMGEDPDIPFYVHRYMGMHRPSWSDEERRAKIAIYGGSEDNVDYGRNIYGNHGDVSNPVFVLSRLMAATRINESPWATEYNERVYAQVKINDEYLKSSGVPIENHVRMGLPGTHLHEQYTSYWAGCDVGFTRDPSEILIFGSLAHPKEKGAELLRLLARIHLMRISAADQAAAVREVFDFYGERLRLFTLDKTGVGLPLWQELDPEAVGTDISRRRTPGHIAQRIKGYGFSEKVAVEFDDRPLKEKENQEDATISKNVVDFATDELRKLVDLGRIELPYDRELLSEWQGQEIQYVRDEGSAAGLKTRYTGGSLHTLDAAKMMIAGKELQNIDAILNAQAKQVPVLARFM